MMAKISYAVSGMFLVFIIFAVIASHDWQQTENRKPEEDGTKPSIYITRTSQATTFDGKTVWILEYTVDGLVQSPLFNSREAMTEYREYLDTIGTVYQRDFEEIL
jgi:hypothetical protein